MGDRYSVTAGYEDRYSVAVLLRLRDMGDRYSVTAGYGDRYSVADVTLLFI